MQRQRCPRYGDPVLDYQQLDEARAKAKSSADPTADIREVCLVERGTACRCGYPWVTWPWVTWQGFDSGRRKSRNLPSTGGSALILASGRFSILRPKESISSQANRHYSSGTSLLQLCNHNAAVRSCRSRPNPVCRQYRTNPKRAATPMNRGARRTATKSGPNNESLSMNGWYQGPPAAGRPRPRGKNCLEGRYGVVDLRRAGV